jgi:lysophospholipase L1-like esterase
MNRMTRTVEVLIFAAFTASCTVAAEPKAAQPANGAQVKKAAAETKPAQLANKADAEKAAAKPEPLIPVEGTVFGSKDDPHGGWRKTCARMMGDIKNLDGNVDIAFIGDSITMRWGSTTTGRYGNPENWKKHWGGYRAVNMGIAADRTQNVLWRLKEGGQLEGYKARLFVLLIGTNNCDKNTKPEDIAQAIKEILDLIKSKQPEAKILLMGIFPTGAKPHTDRDRKSAVNALIKNFEGGAVSYIDIWDKFLEPDGTISKQVMGDYLHLEAKGYDIWAEAIKGKVKEVLGEAKAE